MKKKIIITLIVLGIIGATATVLRHFKPGHTRSTSFRTDLVSHGDLLITISATGTVEPEEVIDVGAQVAGQIVSFGKDADDKTVDYGSRVEKGTVLTRIDDSLYSAEVAKAKAEVKSAEARIQRTEAELEHAKAELYQAERNWRRAQKIGPSEALSQSSYDAYNSGYEMSKANVMVKQAAILEAKANLTQAEATLQWMQRNLGYCTIKSPVKGVIIDRRVNIGQTVVASLNAPSLFLLAKDLKRMQVWVAVNEADLGKIRTGQHVTFTVDALPDESFEGEVGKIRLNASMTQNVVTYTVEVITDNSDRCLLPYLTANVLFEVDRRNDVLLVPNTALRWKPPAGQIEPEFRTASRPSRERRTKSGSATVAQAERTRMTESRKSLLQEIISKYDPENFSHVDFVAMGEALRKSGIGQTPEAKSILEEAGFNIEQYNSNGSVSMDRPPVIQGEETQQPVSTSKNAKNNSEDRGVIWIQQGEYVRPVNVITGITDGIMTEVHGDKLTEGMEVVIGVQTELRTKRKGKGERSNPFMTDLPSRKGGQPR